MSWHPAHEQWGATQMQNRFQRAANRFMLPIDYQAWVAVRAIGESASRVGSGDFAPVNAFLRSDEFGLAAFKGQKVTFRRWDGQLRQPIIVAGPELAGLDLAAGRLSALSTPRSIRLASTSRKANANSNDNKREGREDEHARRCARDGNRRGDWPDRRGRARQGL